MTCHGCQARPAAPGSHYCDTCERAWRNGAAVIGGAAVLPMGILAQDDPGTVAGQLDLAHALNEGDTMPDTNAAGRDVARAEYAAAYRARTDPTRGADGLTDAERNHYAPSEAMRTDGHAVGIERRSGDDRRAPVPSPTGDRWRNVADSLDAIGNTNADHADNPDTFLRGYATGQADAYAAAARIVRALADAEDSR